MTRKDHFADVKSEEWAGYFSKAEEHRTSAGNLAEDGNYNSACLLLVHAAIGYSDAVSVFVLERKSTADSHDASIRLLEDKFIETKDREAIKHLGRVLGAKGRIEYTGTAFRERDWTEMKKHLDRFRAWAITKLPPRAGAAA